MSSVRQRIMTALIAALNTGRPTGVPAADLEHVDTYPKETASAISVFKAREPVVPVGGKFGPLVKRTLDINVECRSRRPELLDPMVVWVTSVIDGNSFGGLAVSTSETDNVWQWRNDNDEMQMAVVTFQIEYQTRTGNQELTK